MTKSERWILSEWRVALDRALNFGEILLHHRERTPYAELDLVFGQSALSTSNLTVIEVKSWNREILGDLWAEKILSKIQLRRLERGCEYLRNSTQRKVSLLIAVTSQEPGSTIQYFEPPCY